MESNEKPSTYFLTVNGEKITVSHEVYQMIRKENNRIRDIERTDFRCSQENFNGNGGSWQRRRRSALIDRDGANLRGCRSGGSIRSGDSQNAF